MHFLRAVHPHVRDSCANLFRFVREATWFQADPRRKIMRPQRNGRKLVLHREAIRLLTRPDDLRAVRGASIRDSVVPCTWQCGVSEMITCSDENNVCLDASVDPCSP